MAEWYVSGSEPEGDEEGVHDGTESLEIGGLQIPPSKVLELMQVGVSVCVVSLNLNLTCCTATCVCTCGVL